MNEITKKDLIDMEERLLKHLDAKLQDLDDKIEHFGTKLQHLDDKIERVETALLTEFHKWASPTDARMRTHSATLHAIDLEMEALTDRLKKLESGANPAQ